MTLRPEEKVIRWRVHFTSSPARVFEALTTDAGRAQYWAETAQRVEDHIRFTFPNGLTCESRIREIVPYTRFSLDYWGSPVTFELTPDDSGGTDLVMTDLGTSDEHRLDVAAGWVSVLLAMKAAVDHGVDLRNHDAERSWDGGYVDN